MCGICGLATTDPSQTVERDLLERMTEVVRYRGPDSEGYHLGPGIGLGVRRLAINDLETGDQPISNEDGTVTVICNGEIYNFLELRRELRGAGHHFRSDSDVEVIVHLYEDLGPECVHRLRGMFAFALWDSRRCRLMLARDRLGIKPLHYALCAEGCYFGSELKSMLASGRIEPRLDPAALRDVFSLGFVMAPKTFFTSIRHLLPGHYLLFQRGRASFHQYWDVRFPPRGEEDSSCNTRRWAEVLVDKLRESVRIHLRSDVPLGAWLSPGIDSSAIVSLMSDLDCPPVETFTLGFDDPSADEVRKYPTLDRYAGHSLRNHQAVATANDFELFPQALWHGEDVSSGTLVRMLVARPTLGRLKVVLTGEGSDELLGGYDWLRLDQLLRGLAGLPLGLRRLIASPGPVRRRWPGASRVLLAPAQVGLDRYRGLLGLGDGAAFQERLFTPDLQRLLASAGDAGGDWRYPADFERWHPFHRLQYLEMKIRLPDAIVRTLDRGSMAYSIEARVPFLDHELVELCARMPVALKVRRLREKYILREAMRGLLPEQIRTRRKRGLHAPVREWLRGELPEFAAELLSGESLRAKGYFRPEAVAQLLTRHQSGRENYARPLMAVLGVQVWDDLFLRGRGPSWTHAVPAAGETGGSSRSPSLLATDT